MVTGVHANAYGHWLYCLGKYVKVRVEDLTLLHG